MNDETLGFNSIHHLHNYFLLKIPYLNGSYIGQNRDIRSQLLQLKMTCQTGLFEQDPDGSGSDGYSGSLCRPGKIFIYLKTSLRTAGHAGNEERKRRSVTEKGHTGVNLLLGYFRQRSVKEVKGFKPRRSALNRITLRIQTDR